ncbi:hypothetical protein LOD99_15297 [Oopsacas minuta]|uniref:Uncharacterized protein n=1 Tax=Oopsacas minuta TaxID=111878 RepID=A0AAV7KBF1_9METZ|nr:hypothetical protein LOD99_15297 [Oopsacas minuta]
MAECNTLEISLEAFERPNPECVGFTRDNPPSENARNDNDRDEIEMNEMSNSNPNHLPKQNSLKGVRALISIFDTRPKNHTKHHKISNKPKSKNDEIQQLQPNKDDHTERKSRKSIKNLFSLGKSKAIDEHDQSNNEQKKLKNVGIKQATIDGLTIHSTISNTLHQPNESIPEFPSNDAHQIHHPEFEHTNDVIIDETRDIGENNSTKIVTKKIKKNHVSFDSNAEHSVKKKGNKNKDSSWSAIERRLVQQDLKNRENLIKELGETQDELELQNTKLVEQNQNLSQENQILKRDLEETKNKLRELQESNTITSVEEMENTPESNDRCHVPKEIHRRISKSFDDKLSMPTTPVADDKRTKKLEKAISEL